MATTAVTLLVLEFSIYFLLALVRFKGLTLKCVPGGTKNSRSEGFSLTKHKHTNIPTMMEPFPPPAPWFRWMSVPHPREPLWKELDEAAIEGFNINYKVKEKLIYFYCLFVNYNNRLPAVSNDSQNGVHCCWRAAIIYELTNNIIMNNSVARC